MPRTKKFNREEIVEKAMNVFWSKGYCTTSIDDLVKHLGINRASMYNTFKDKHRLFLDSLQKYKQTQANQLIQMTHQAIPVKEILANLFATKIDELIADRQKKGCLMVNSTIELASQDKETAEIALQNQEEIEKAFALAFEKAQIKGEISSKHRPEELASFIFTTLSGLWVVAKANPDRQMLENIVKVTLSILD